MRTIIYVDTFIDELRNGGIGVLQLFALPRKEGDMGQHGGMEGCSNRDQRRSNCQSIGDSMVARCSRSIEGNIYENHRVTDVDLTLLGT